MDEKSLSPQLFPLGGGQGGAVCTNNWCITDYSDRGTAGGSRVHRNTGTPQNTGTHLYLPEHTINIGFSFTYVWFYDFIIICMSLIC